MDWNKIKAGAKDLADKGLNASKDLAEKQLEKSKEKKELKKQEERELKERIAKMDRDGIVYCPKCYSTQVSANKRGLSLGQTVAGGLLVGAMGKNKIEVTCLKCGHKWKAGKK